MEDLLKELNDDINDSKYMKRCLIRHGRNQSSPAKITQETTMKRLKQSMKSPQPNLNPMKNEIDSDDDNFFTTEEAKFLKELELKDQVEYNLNS